MNLNYSILWFDDDKDYFESLTYESGYGPIESGIHDLGFIPQLTKVTEPKEFMAYEPWDQFDLIVVDFTLENHTESGGDFITKVRDHAVLTEVIFYSSQQNSELWKEIESRKLEGVYVANRKQIESKILRVAEHSVRKVLDLENMRGIVMALVGEIDHVLDEIIVLAMSKLPEKARADIFQRGHAAITEQSKKRHEALDGFITSPTVEALLALCDSDKRWQNFCRIRRHLPELKSLINGNYAEEVLTKRNFLAHGIPKPHADGGHVFSYFGKEYHFTEEESLSLRRLLNDYKSKFREAVEVCVAMNN